MQNDTNQVTLRVTSKWIQINIKQHMIHQILNANSFCNRYIHTHVRTVTLQIVNVTVHTVLQLTECNISSMEIYVIRGKERKGPFGLGIN